MSDTASVLRIRVGIEIWLELRPPIGHEEPGGYHFLNDRTDLGFTNLSSGSASTLVRLIKRLPGTFWLPDITDDSFIVTEPISIWATRQYYLTDKAKEAIRAFWQERLNEVVASLPELGVAFPNWRVTGISAYDIANEALSSKVKFRGYRFNWQEGIKKKTRTSPSYRGNLLKSR